MEEKGTEEKTGTISLIDGKQNYKRKQTPQKSNSCSSSRIWVFFTVLFFLTTVAAVAAFIWRHSFFDDQVKERRTNTTEQLYVKFKGFFRTPSEQREFAARVYQAEKNDVRYANYTQEYGQNRTCSVYCPGPKDNGPARRKRQITLGNTHYHACCISETYFESYDVLPGIDDQPRVIAQLDDQKQYFQTQNCRQAIGCNGCQCQQVIDTHTALIQKENVSDDDDDDKYYVDFVKVPGCCKCINS